MLYLVMVLLCGIVGCSTGKPPPGPVPTDRTTQFWFYNKASVEKYTANPLPNTGVYLNAFDSDAAHVAAIHAKGLKAVMGFTGNLPQTPAAVAAANALATKYGTIGIDYLQVNEPRGPAPALVAYYNPLFALFKAAHPGAQVGICQDSGDFHKGMFAAGLKADFACLEAYSGDTMTDVSQIRVAYPAVKIMMLVYGKAQACSMWPDPQIDIIGFWNVDNNPSLTDSLESGWYTEALGIAAGGC